MKIYYIKLNNYHGEDDIEYYRNKKNAYHRYNELFDEGKHKKEFKQENINSFSFFDSSYNEYSTYISLHECLLNELFCD